MDSLRSFEELNCWKEAVILRRELKPLIDGLPKNEEYRLKDQLVRCLRSVTNNIAEGYGRFNHQENIQFCRISRGSLHEITDHLIIAAEENYITPEELSIRKEQINKCLAILNGYINYLKKAKEAGTNK
ncbi:MAG: four helix bundle protein [Ferruginibacter sp.]|jgi:four helix bundle protein|nr:four helix bundle protein [Chitinophagaceae bacterium]MBP6287351.1 four helix bundle protein [Ferruginibacter sp.]MBU9936380.1 four helix bundle protein [Ferruginibacter sp.]